MENIILYFRAFRVLSLALYNYIEFKLNDITNFTENHHQSLFHSEMNAVLEYSDLIPVF